MLKILVATENALTNIPKAKSATKIFHAHVFGSGTGDVSAAAPLVTWNNHTGVVTMTYFSVLKKYIMSISTATYYPYMTKQFDTYFLESDAITGPWAYVNYNAQFGPEAYSTAQPLHTVVPIV